MKILHTADWHLGKKLDNFYRLNEQREVLAEICEIAEKKEIDAVLIAGDIFDAFNPPTEAVELFYKTIKRLSNNGKRPVILIAGNHDSPDRIDLPSPLANECGIISVGYPNAKINSFKLDTELEVSKVDNGFFELNIPGIKRPLRILHTAYANEYRMKQFLGTENKEGQLEILLEENWKELAKKYCDKEGVNLILAHLFFAKRGAVPEIEPEDEKPILHVGGVPAIHSTCIPEEIDYTALGHLHRGHTVDNFPCLIAYSGSPLSYSFAEAEQKKYVAILDFDNEKKLEIEKVILSSGKKLVKVRFKKTEEAILWLKDNPNTLVEITLETNCFLTAEDRKNLYNSHDGIVSIIPEIKHSDGTSNQERSIAQDQNINDLFAQYFEFKTGSSVNEEITDLFKEIIAIETE